MFSFTIIVQTCPVCRKDIRKQKFKKNKMIDQAVRSHILSQNDNGEETLKYKTRVNVYSQWKQSHQLGLVKAGQKVDVRDTEYIWCSGEVELKISTLNRPVLLYIHYQVSCNF